MENNFEIEKYFESMILEESHELYHPTDYPFKSETFKIIGACMEVHNELGNGLLEIVYKDALEIEFNLQKIEFEREKQFEVVYKSIKLNRHYYADFLVFNNIILEIKSDQSNLESHMPQVLNYLAISKCKIGLLINFGREKLYFKRVIL